MRAKVPCLNCNDRQCGCHSSCERYKEYRQQLDQERANISKQKALLGGVSWNAICHSHVTKVGNNHKK